MKLTELALRRLIRQSLHEARTGSPRLGAQKGDIRPGTTDVVIKKVESSTIDHDSLDRCINEIIFQPALDQDDWSEFTGEDGQQYRGIPFEELIIPIRGAGSVEFSVDDPRMGRVVKDNGGGSKVYIEVQNNGSKLNITWIYPSHASIERYCDERSEYFGANILNNYADQNEEYVEKYPVTERYGIDFDIVVSDSEDDMLVMTKSSNWNTGFINAILSGERTCSGCLKAACSDPQFAAYECPNCAQEIKTLPKQR
jgi:hypothetical protein